MSKSNGSNGELGILKLDPTKIKITKNPRTQFSLGFTPERMAELKQGIIQDGLNNPLLVFKNTDGHYELIGGERRLRSILQLIEEDNLSIKEGGDSRVLCRNPKTGKSEPVSEVYKAVECRVTTCENAKEERRKRITDNTLHEPLSEFELLLQVEEMEKEGFTRAEQATTMRKSEAWISQSHSLLKSHPHLLDAIQKDKIKRTTAIKLLTYKPEEVPEILNQAIKINMMETEIEEDEAFDKKEEALKKIEEHNDVLTMSQFKGDLETARVAKKEISEANRALKEADKQIENATKKKKKGVISAENIEEAAKQAGVQEKNRRPLSPKQIREQWDNINELLKKDKIINPENGYEYDRGELEFVSDVIGCLLGERGEDNNPLQFLKPIKKTKLRKA